MSSIIEFEKEFIEDRALEALEGLNLFLGADPEIIDSMSPEEVREELEEIGVPAAVNKLEEIMKLVKGKVTYGDYWDENELDVEKDLIVAIPPVKRRKVKIRAKNLGPAKLRVVYDPLPDE